ncbi:MAG: hypothetical protein ACI9IP_000321 [Arcticibacterium sp.]|jgi:hypothetical protein
MKFQFSVEIESSFEEVSKLFIDPKYLHEYQEGFVKKVFQNGTEGQDGAISMMHYKHGKQEMELKEAVVSNKLPHSFEAFYEHKHMHNTLLTKFIPIAETEGEYVRVSWFMTRLVPWMFIKPPKRWMNNFKKFAEEYVKMK